MIGTFTKNCLKSGRVPYDYLFKPCPDEPLEDAAENVKAAWKAEYKIHSDDFGDLLETSIFNLRGEDSDDLHAFLKVTMKGFKRQGLHLSTWLFKRVGVERKLSYGEQYLHVGNGAQAAVEAIGVDINLVLSSSLVLSLNNCRYAPSIIRSVVSFSRLLDLGFVHTVTSNGISYFFLQWIFYFFSRMASLLRRLYGRETAHALVEKKGKAKDEYYGKLILDLGNEVRSSMEQGTTAMERLVEKLSNTKDKAECKRLKKELEEAKFNNTFLRMQNKPVERDLYWTRVRAHEFYQEMIHRGFVFEERPNEAINVSIKDENNPSFEPRGSPYDENVDVAVTAERARHANVGNDARGSGPARGQDAAPATRECTFARFMKCNPTAFCGTEGAVELLRWFKKTESVFGISDYA
ncbi:hypothetical protein Tco_0681876 [Tanacetum coccineum]|uniref:Uncharacterized protein n=1 Tax=Tanacetum coccineum TaxID=301880 RepID=A0ABQ4XQG8_9ASTR